jgi:ribokinase
MTRPIVTIVGSFAVGITIRTPRFPVRGETLIGRDFDMGPGGKGSNQAVGAARLGAESHLIARIGKDPLAEIATHLYAQEGVGTDHLIHDADRATGVGVITVNEEGENHIVLDLGANLHLSPEDVDAAEDRIKGSGIVAAVLEIPVAAASRGLELARRHGVRTLLNPAPAQALADEVLALADYLTPNESELRLLCGLPPDDADADTLSLARRLQERGARNVVVTRGGRGALILSERGNVTETPALPTDVVDTTGAGDAFNSALAVALAEGRPLTEAVRFAAGAGALACTRLGAIPALPRRAALEARLQEAKL